MLVSKEDFALLKKAREEMGLTHEQVIEVAQRELGMEADWRLWVPEDIPPLLRELELCDFIKLAKMEPSLWPEAFAAVACGTDKRPTFPTPTLPTEKELLAKFQR